MPLEVGVVNMRAIMPAFIFLDSKLAPSQFHELHVEHQSCDAIVDNGGNS